MDEKVKEETVRQETATATGKAPEEDKAGCLGEIGQGEATTEAGGQAGQGKEIARTEWQENEKRDEGEERRCAKGS